MGILSATIAPDFGFRVSLRRAALALGAVFIAALVSATSASAAFTHSPTPVITFGPNGGPESATNSFYYQTSREIRFDDAEQRLYLLRPELWNVSGTPPPPGYSEPPRGIFAFDMASPGDYTPLNGSFPLQLNQPSSGLTHMAVDESEGIVYYVEGTNNQPANNHLSSWDRTGKMRPGFPKTIAHSGYMAVDPLGYLWILDTNSGGPSTVYKYDPDGTLLGSVDVSAFGQGPISFNRITGDMWIRRLNKSVKLTAASNYTAAETIPTPGEANSAVAIDAKHGVIYATNGRVIYAYNETGDRVGAIGPGDTSGEIPWRNERPSGYFGNYKDVAFNEDTGDLYAIDERRSGSNFGFNPELGNYLGSDIAVWPGIDLPDVESRTPTSVGHTEATLTGHVTPDSDPVISCQFEYITEGERENVRKLEVQQATGGTFKVSFGGSIPYNATANEVQSAIGGGAIVSGPAGGPWRVQIANAASLAITSNSLKPLAAEVSLDWDANMAPCSPSASAGSPISTGTDVSSTVTGLTTGTTYRYRLAASDKDGRSVSSSSTFTPPPSLVSTGAATEIVRDGAKLNGTVDPEGLTTTFYFEYGLSSAYGQTSSVPPGVDVGTTEAGAKSVSSSISGLGAETTYHYRIVAVNSKGTSYGVDRTFTTAPNVKSVTTEAATEIARTSAQLNGALDPDGLPTTYYFEWGKSRRYGSVSATPPGGSSGPSTPGVQHLNAVAAGLEPDTTYHYRIVAANGNGVTAGADRTFTTLKAVVGLVTEPTTELKVDSARIHGELDPDGFQTDYIFEWGKTTTYGHNIPSQPENVGTSDPGAVQLEGILENLEPGVTYHYRLVATNSFGTTAGADQSFKTPQPPSIESFSSSHLTATGAELEAKINPHGAATNYEFEYGPSTEYGLSAPGTLEPLESAQSVSAVLTGLEAGRTYHFRVVAESEWGMVVTEDQSFDFTPPNCPNNILRQRTTSAYLPDCRAYEIVSPARAGGALIEPSAPSSAAALNHFAFTGGFTAIPGSGNPINGFAPDLYVATRTTEGWKTRYVGLSADQSGEQASEPREVDANRPFRIPSDLELTHFLTWDHSGAQVYSYAPFMWDSDSNYLGRLPTNVEEVPGALIKPSEGGFKGDIQPSPDMSHFVFSAIRTSFAPGGVAESPGSVYDNDIATKQIQIVSKTASGANIPQDPLAGKVGEFIRIPAVSTDGSHILMSTEAPGEQVHLYMWAEGVNYDVSVGEDGINHGVKFDGMTADGSAVYFTTAARMTSDDQDSSPDLYRWSATNDSLTRLSVGAEGNSGNSDNCNTGWTQACGAVVVPTEPGAKEISGVARDNALAARAGDIYFYSPEQLDLGARGVPGQRNLYVWHQGVVRYVATIDAAKPISNVNVTEDGAFAAFITKSQLTPYNNAEHSEMYRFSAQSRKITCVSCIPDGSPPTSDIEGAMNGIFLTENGRAFFSTVDSLTPRDANESIDVYEYVEGRPQLISSGTGSESPSNFQFPGLLGVSSDGVNAFFYTSQVLVPQDENGPFFKVYDARVNGGFEFTSPPAPCAAADECHGEGSQAPSAPRIGSGAPLGDNGNATIGKKAKHHRHKANKKKHKHKKKKHHRRRSETKGGQTR